MSRVRDVMAGFQEFAEPRDGIRNGPFRLASTLQEPASEHEILAAWRNRQLPEDLVELWTTCREARLFEDIDYGQWGLHVLSPVESANRTAMERDARSTDIGPNDVVFGEFLGDQELLVRTPGDRDDGVLVALPLDRKSDWHRAGRDIAEFLERYLASAGEKYWESTA
ncbi:MAG: SMI1/KNR4 family protein [Actinomycetota bacterium]